LGHPRLVSSWSVTFGLPFVALHHIVLLIVLRPMTNDPHWRDRLQKWWKPRKSKVSGLGRRILKHSGGRGDAYTCAIGHKEDQNLVIDVIRGAQPPFDPQEVTKQYAALLKQYCIGEVTGDFYGPEWVAACWQSCGVRYIRSELNKSAIYLEALPLLARGLVRLPNHPRLLRELRLLERHTHRSGRDTVDHGRNGSDDFATSCCGVLRNLSNFLGYDYTYAAFQD